MLRRSADGTILSPFYRESSLPPFSGASSTPSSPSGALSAAASRLAAGAAMARRLADMLVHPAAGSSQCSPWSPPGRTATQQQKPVAADGLLVGTPSTSAEQLGCKASAAGTAQEPASSSLALPCSRGCPAAPPPPELAWHVAACELERPELRPDPAGGWQQLQQQQLSASSLPPRLRELFVDPSHIEIVSGLRGRLGEGAR